MQKILKIIHEQSKINYLGSVKTCNARQARGNFSYIVLQAVSRMDGQIP